MDSIPLKICARCKISLPIALFNRHHRAKDGLQSYCKNCQSLMNGYKRRIWLVISVPEGFRLCSQCAEVYPATSEFFNRYGVIGLRRTCKKCQSKAYGDWYDCHIDYQSLRQKIRRENNPSLIREANRKYRTQHPEKVRVFRARRRDREQAKPTNFTENQWKYALNYFGGCCAVCGRPPGLWHIIAMDHWIPLSNDNCPGTTIGNIVPLCHGQDGCNNSKKDRLPQEWLIWKFGKRKAKSIEARIMEYFRQGVAEEVQ